MWPNPQEFADLVTFTEEMLNGKLHFLCSVVYGGKYNLTNCPMPFVILQYEQMCETGSSRTG